MQQAKRNYAIDQIWILPDLEKVNTGDNPISPRATGGLGIVSLAQPCHRLTTANFKLVLLPRSHVPVDRRFAGLSSCSNSLLLFLLLQHDGKVRSAVLAAKGHNLASKRQQCPMMPLDVLWPLTCELCSCRRTTAANKVTQKPATTPWAVQLPTLASRGRALYYVRRSQTCP